MWNILTDSAATLCEAEWYLYYALYVHVGGKGNLLLLFQT